MKAYHVALSMAVGMFLTQTWWSLRQGYICFLKPSVRFTYAKKCGTIGPTYNSYLWPLPTWICCKRSRPPGSRNVWGDPGYERHTRHPDRSDGNEIRSRMMSTAIGKRTRGTETSLYRVFRETSRLFWTSAVQY